MKVLLVYPNLMMVPRIPLSLAYISSYLKQFDHEVDLLDLTFGWDEELILNKVKKFNPDLIAFSVVSHDFEFANSIAEIIKSVTDAPILFGGYHVTFLPEEAIRMKFVDMICIGEGEDTILELTNRINDNQPISNVLGLWLKDKDGRIHKNPTRPLDLNLDKYPFPDRELFDKKHIVGPAPERFLFYSCHFGSPILTMRGCPFQCTYCSEPAFNKLYNFKNFVRYRSVDNVMQELELMMEKYDVKYIDIVDDTFTLNKQRTLEFCKEYERRIGLPFSIKTHPNVIDRDILFSLKRAGCDRIFMGIENGNENIRKNVMNRHINREQIIDAFKLAAEAGIKTFSFNILGVPEETRKTIFETIELNKECKPHFPRVFIFLPLVGTRLWEYTMENNLLNGRNVKSFLGDSSIVLEKLNRRDLIALQRVFHLYVKLPKSLWFIPFGFEKMLRYAPDNLRSFILEFNDKFRNGYMGY